MEPEIHEVKSSASNDRRNSQIQKLVQRIPRLLDIFTLHRKIGEGSYGSVFLASLKCDSLLSDNKKKFFALKYLIPISLPNRIEQELECLKTIGGCDNVVGVDLCIRQNDAVVFIMPYISHIKFSEYFQYMDQLEIKLYIKNLLLALRRVHQFNVIHRDVKPGNFLYDRINRRYLLVDFGLSQKVYYKQPPAKPKTLTNNIPAYNKSTAERINLLRKRKLAELLDKEDNLQEMNSKYIKSDQNQSIHNNISSRLQNTNAKIITSTLAKRIFTSHKKPTALLPVPKTVDNKRPEQKLCYCYGLPSVCNICLNRQPYKASRSGTSGYRPPEVLLKYPDQTTAVDVWAAGVIFLSLLSGCYPFFSATDDFTALAEQVTIFSSLRFKKVAHVLGRNFLCSYSKRPIDLRKLCTHLRSKNGLKLPIVNETNGCESNSHLVDNKLPSVAEKPNSSAKDPTKSEPICDDCALSIDSCVCLDLQKEFNYTSKIEDKNWAGFPDAAFDLLEKLLDLNPHTRISASNALNHPYLAD